MPVTITALSPTTAVLPPVPLPSTLAPDTLIVTLVTANLTMILRLVLPQLPSVVTQISLVARALCLPCKSILHAAQVSTTVAMIWGCPSTIKHTQLKTRMVRGTEVGGTHNDNTFYNGLNACNFRIAIQPAFFLIAFFFHNAHFTSS